MRVLIAASFWLIAAIGALIAQSEVAAAAKPREVKGLVVDEAGKPIAGVAIGRCEPFGPVLPGEAVAQPLATTDANGAFAFAERPDESATQLWFVAPGRVHVACSIDVVDRQPIVLGMARAIAGRVVDADGKPLGSVHVRAFDALVTAEWLPADSACFVCTIARTDAQGRFVLSGACAEGMLLGVELPNGAAECGPTAAGEPVELRVRELPTLTIAVRDRAGRPVAGARVRTFGRGRLSPRFDATRCTDAGGIVRVANDGIHDVTVQAKVDGALAVDDASCEPGATTVRLQLRVAAAIAADAPTLDVRAVDELGKPLRDFRAALFATDGERLTYSTDVLLLRRFARVSRTAVDGVAKVPWQPDEARDGAYVVVAAAGCALARVPAAANGQPLEVMLAPAVPITGVVVDKKTDAPLAGARVWSLPAGQGNLDLLLAQSRSVEGLDPQEGVVVTGASGEFTLTQAGVGVHHVFCRLPGGGWCKPVSVTLTGDGASKKLRLSLPPLQTFTVRTGLAPPPFGARLRLLRKNEPRFGDVENRPLADVALTADGSAELSGVQPDNYVALLIVPGRFRQGGVGSIQLGTVRVGIDQAAVEFDGRKALPAVVRGRITGPVPGGRLVVVSIGKHEGNAWIDQLHCSGPFALVGLGGSYELQEPPGERALLVFDLATGVLLHRGELVEVATASTRVLDVAVRAHEVELQFRTKDRTTVAPLQVELRPEATFWPTGLGLMSDLDKANPSYPCGMGIGVPGDLQPVRVWLPACDVRARLWVCNPQRVPVRRQELAIDVAGKPAKAIVFDLDEAK